MSGTSVMIEIYAGRMETSNPGVPILSSERFIDGYQSRNRRLASLMRRLGICEEKGSGIDRVVNQVESHQLPAPDLSVSQVISTAIDAGLVRPDETVGSSRKFARYLPFWA